MHANSDCDVGVLGSGIIGLSCALSLSRAGYRVKILARNLPGDQTPDWASPWAGAVICLTPSDDETDIKMQTTSYRHYWAMAQNDPANGVQAVRVASYWDDDILSPDPWYSKLTPGFRSLQKHELPPKTIHDVEFLRGEVQSLDQAREVINCKILVNATGLGARVLANDPDVIGIRGQTILVKASESDVGAPASLAGDMAIQRGKEYTYFIPRACSGGFIIGGIEDEGNISTHVDAELRKDILRRVNIMTGDMFGNVDLERDVLRDIVGFRPGRKSGPRIEREGNIVHAYGFGGVGYKYSFGAAQRVVQMVEESLAVRPKL